MSALRSLVCLLALGPTGAGGPSRQQEHLDEARGMRVEVPSGWRTVEQEQGDDFVLYLVPPDTGGRVLLAFSVRELEPGQGLEALVARSEARIASDPVYSALERYRVELLGEERPALRVRMRSEAGERTIEAAFLVDDGRGYVVQRAAPPEDFERWADELARVVATFRPVPISAAGREQRRLAELAARCGSELDWAPSWDEAARRARAQDRPVLVVAWLYGGFELPHTPRSTTFMDPDVLALVAERFVPWAYRVGETTPFSERYGLSRTSFGQGLLVVSPEGELVAQSVRAADPDFAYAFLCQVLGARGEKGRDGADAGTRLERARQALARGRPDVAGELLAEARTAEEHLLWARVERLSRRGESARAALARARALAPEPTDDFERALLAEEARLHLRLQDAAAVRTAGERLFTRHAGSPEALEAALLLGLCEARAGERAAAGARWRALTEEHPESRWAWQAAALLASGWLERDLPLDLGFPDEAVLSEALVQPSSAPLPRERARAARDQARAWLLASQRADGSWVSPMVTSAEDRTPSPFVDAVTALATRALLAHLGERGVEPAVERALAFLLASLARRAETPTRVLYMDYTPWSDAAMLDTFAAALEARQGEPERLRAAAAEILADLEGRAQPHGGWGYYVSGDLDGPAAPPTTMSFTTAAVVLSLAHARRAGLEVPASLLERGGVSALVAMRDGQGVYAYSLVPGGGAGVAAGMEPGAAGRAPACELALLRAGASDEERLEGALARFLEHAHTLAAERGKVLMHAGPAAQGCHYVLFDHAWAAAAWRAGAREPRTRARLLELLMACRQDDGSFLDTTINGRAYGTAMALLALDDLEADGR